MRVRFAPSPTGHLRAATSGPRSSTGCSRAASAARSSCGSKTPTPSGRRSNRRVGIQRDLQWLGLDWDEGPDTGGAHGPYAGSPERLHLYQSYAKELLADDAAYYCFCSVAQLEAERKQARSPRAARASCAGTLPAVSRDGAASRITAGERPAIRFRVPDDRERRLRRRRARRRAVSHAASSAIRSSSAPTAGRPTTSPWSWTMR